MNRIFHVRIMWYQYAYLVVLGGVSFFLLWDKNIILAVLCMVLLVFLIERFIHTTYTVTTDDRIIIYTGRFSGSKTVRLKDIVSVERRSSAKIGRFSLLQYITIEFDSGRYVSVVPLKEQEFLELLLKRKEWLIGN